jgi:hypothetical protein
VGIGYFKKKLIISCIDTLLVLTREEKAMQEYANEYTPDFQEAMDDLAEYRESKNMLNRMKTVDFRKEIVEGCTYSTPDLKTNHDGNCTCSYCDPVDERYQVIKDQTEDNREVNDVKHGEHCGCPYCRGDRLGTVDAEPVSLKQFSSKAEEREYLYLEEQKHLNDPTRKFIKGDLPTDTKSFSDMYDFWKTNLAEDLEKEYTAASKKDIEPLWTARDGLKDTRKKEWPLNTLYSPPDHSFKSDKKKTFEGNVEEYWKSQLKSANGDGRVHWTKTSPFGLEEVIIKTKLVVVYVGSGNCSQSKLDKIINKYRPTFTELQGTMPQCNVIFVPDVGAQEGQIRIETHDLS